MSFYDFNTAEEQVFELIPAGTLAKVNMRIKIGGYNDPEQGWTLDYATKNWDTGAVYLNCEFTIVDGEYAGRKIWQLIGLYSQKNDNRWGAMGRGFIRSILNSAKGFTDKDNSEAAQLARKINSFADLDGLEFVARIEIQSDSEGNNRNFIKRAISSEHKDYSKLMQSVSVPAPGWLQ